jgi:hypothetical protein
MKLLILLTLFVVAQGFGDQVRTVVPNGDVIKIFTAPGISTVIKLSRRPTRVFTGDQEAYKVEADENSVTIKPLVENVPSNLFINTETDEFAFTLIPADRRKADYVVKLESPLGLKSSANPDPTNSALDAKLYSSPVTAWVRGNHVRLEIVSVQFPATKSSLIINAKLTLEDFKQTVVLRPSEFKISQKGRRVSMVGIHASSPILSNDYRTSEVTFVIRYSVLKKRLPIELQVGGIGETPLRVSFSAI